MKQDIWDVKITIAGNILCIVHVILFQETLKHKWQVRLYMYQIRHILQCIFYRVIDFIIWT